MNKLAGQINSARRFKLNGLKCQAIFVVARKRPTIAEMPPKTAVREVPKVEMSPAFQATIEPVRAEPMTASADQMVWEAQNGFEVSGLLVAGVALGKVASIVCPFGAGELPALLCRDGGMVGLADVIARAARSIA